MNHLVGGSLLLLVIVIWVFWKVSIHLTAPISQLTNIMEMNIKKVQKNKNRNDAENVKLQMEFAGGYKEHNREMNDLYLSYSQLAKILTVGQ
jgi:sensor histidine kinase YesM